MLIEYIGHACFYLTSRDGTKILIDPYDPSIGLAPFTRPTDILLMTHKHYDHCYTAAASGDYDTIDSPGQRASHGTHIIGLTVPHDDDGGAARGTVTAFIIETDGMRILHLGDIGGVPSGEFLESIGKIDVLMVPVGGTYTVDAAGALQTADLIDANITIPMHYKTKRSNLDIKPPHAFLEAAKQSRDISRLGSNKFDIDAASLKKRGRVVFMENAYDGA